MRKQPLSRSLSFGSVGVDDPSTGVVSQGRWRAMTANDVGMCSDGARPLVDFGDIRHTRPTIASCSITDRVAVLHAQFSPGSSKARMDCSSRCFDRIMVVNRFHFCFREMPLFSGQCKSKARLDGKTALVTGSNSGIGKETVLDFYKRGARVIMACRDINKAQTAKLEIEDQCKDIKGVGFILVEKCDLSSLESIRTCAQNVLDTERQLNILVNNAGVMMCPKSQTADGFEMHFGSNHLGHFLLTLLLLPKIRNSTPARIVTVASKAHILSYGIDFKDLNYRHRTYYSMGAYAQSKLANIIFSKELARKLKEHGIEGINTYSLHPGVIPTGLTRHLDETVVWGARFFTNLFMRVFNKTATQGAQTTIYCAVDEKCANETGLYYSDCKAVTPAAAALDDEVATKLWKVSAELVGLQNYDPFTAIDSEIKECAQETTAFFEM
ncbi:hypothetical protein EVAR_79267_1 [Eumeta japonica]|uniref:Retinol dehydrogenase 11 n=1 Tax=Eumeta variegata TaxID=151549 RepID=A0A4C1THZ8_EUMVA|nr:hypothetical protein EVAR_79267_1 [Eumeta japonica]